MTEMVVRGSSTNGVSFCSNSGMASRSNASASPASNKSCNNSTSSEQGTARPTTGAGRGNDVGEVWSSSAELTHTLPKLPIPDLECSIDKYLGLIKPVVGHQQFAKTKLIADEFCKASGQGPQLQDYLLKRQQDTDNWANDWWLHDMYLNIKLPLLINSNPVTVFPYQASTSRRQQVRFTAKLVCGMLDFKRYLDTETLPVERCKSKEKGQPLCMEQHYRLFTSYRQPGRERDIQKTDLGVVGGTDFLVVACCGQFYRLDVRLSGEYIKEADLCLQLSRILDMADTRDQSPEVGLLTSQARHVWAEHRERLLEDPTNRGSLHTLENCLFLICLDKPTVPTCGSSKDDLGSDLTARTHHIIHGQGVVYNTGNRWMDKTIQLIVSEDGTCGVNMEHSVAEGIALWQLIEHSLTFMSKQQIPDVHIEADNMAPPAILGWNLSSQSLADIRTARDSVDRCVDDLDLSVFKFDSYGRDFIKNQNPSPDAFIQLALQLTYYKIHGALTFTYESASIRRFRQGRVDVIRANSQAALTWVKAMLGQTDSMEDEKLQLFKEAAQWQQDYTLDTVQGYGIDLHILGLREAAGDLGTPTPELFKDLSYKEFNTFRLSTSQVPTLSGYWMGYGAVVPDGYGCCYNPQPNHIIFSVASFFACEDTSSDMYANSLESSLLQMAELCTYRPDNLVLHHRQT
uniref:Choline O-acetyltransferase n=1 Tax=Ambigolimax valentianus TaxID=1338344 RepID=U3U8R2_9EUPU|nr:choline acetyltransferase [Ambigolimax valentianus]